MINESILKSEEKAVFALRSLYRKYGYLPYKMSKFEPYEYYIRNKDFLVSDRFITFNDTSGRLLALKPDVTLSILKNGEDQSGCIQKVCYNENVYRVSGKTGQFKEIMQAGLECIGDIGLYEIYEVVCLAAQSLALISDDFVLQISHLGILSALLDQISMDEDFRREAINCISGKNTHDLRRLCEESGIAPQMADALESFTAIYGQRSDVIARLEQLCGDCAEAAIAQLRQLSKLLDRVPFSNKITFDFSVVGNMNYYSGIVFKGYLAGISDSVLSGGQYDKLMQKMGRKAGAVGFALYLDLLEQLPREKTGYDVDVLLVYDPEADSAAVAEAAAALVAQGKTVSAQKRIPAKLRYRQLVTLNKEGTPC